MTWTWAEVTGEHDWDQVDTAGLGYGEGHVQIKVEETNVQGSTLFPQCLLLGSNTNLLTKLVPGL